MSAILLFVGGMVETVECVVQDVRVINRSGVYAGKWDL